MHFEIATVNATWGHEIDSDFKRCQEDFLHSLIKQEEEGGGGDCNKN